VKKRIRPLFAQERAALNAGLFVDRLLGDERRKTGWMRAEAAGDPGPWRQQAVLGRDRWDADALTFPHALNAARAGAFCQSSRG
jgi:SRSO17 transposase